MTILLEDGTYTLNQMIWIDGDHVTFVTGASDVDSGIVGIPEGLSKITWSIQGCS